MFRVEIAALCSVEWPGGCSNVPCSIDNAITCATPQYPVPSPVEKGGGRSRKLNKRGKTILFIFNLFLIKFLFIFLIFRYQKDILVRFHFQIIFYVTPRYPVPSPVEKGGGRRELVCIKQCIM